MLCDILMPFLDLEAADPVGDYLAALQLFNDVAGDVDVVIPGHGSVGTAEQVRERIAQDRDYVLTLREGGADNRHRSPILSRRLRLQSPPPGLVRPCPWTLRSRP